MNLNKILVPSSREEDINGDKTTWVNGRCVTLDEGERVTIFLFHEDETVTDPETGSDATAARAFAFKVDKPVTRAGAINSAEMEAYNLVSPMQVAAFAASMARKFRENPEDAEVKEHDEFIAEVKRALTDMGV